MNKRPLACWPKSASEAITWALENRPVEPQAALALAMNTLANHAPLATALDRQAMQIVTVNRVVVFARALGKESALREQTKLPGFEAAFINYHNALWAWAEAMTPDKVFALLNEAHFAPPGPVPINRAEFEAAVARARREYILDRAIYVALFSVGEGFSPKHAEFFATFSETARRMGDTTEHLGDQAVFEKARQHRYGSTPKGSGKGGLKFALLTLWLPAGLWRMTSRKEQFGALLCLWPSLPRLTERALPNAQARLGLGWRPR